MPYVPCELSYAEDWMHDQMKKIWKLSFGDSDRIINLFFRQRLVNGNALVALEQKTVAGALYLLPAEYKKGDEYVPAYYLYALAVLPEYRARGIGKLMMQSVFERCRREGAVCILRPAGESLAQYYESVGMKRGFHTKTVSFPARRDALACPDFNHVTSAFYTKARDRHFGTRDGYVRWDRPAVRFALEMNTASGGAAWRISEGSCEEEYVAMGHMDGHTLVIEETTLPPEKLNWLGNLAVDYRLDHVRVTVSSWFDYPIHAITEGMLWGAGTVPDAYLGLSMG